jgi:PEGA domain-containing protein
MGSPRAAALVPIAAVVATWLAAGAASARVPRRKDALPRVAILDVRVTGDASPELRRQLDKSLAGGLAAAGYEVLGREATAARLKGARDLAGCTTPTCLERVAKLVDAKRFVRATVDARGDTYTIEVQLFGPDVSGGLIRRVEKRCAPCTVPDMNDSLSAAALELFVTEARAPTSVRVIVTSQPPGATLSVDGELLGVAPQTVELLPGEHWFRATLPAGYQPGEVRRRFDAADDLQTLEIPLTSAPAPATAPAVGEGEGPARPRWGAWKWVAAGGAAALLATGIVVWTKDGDLVDCLPGAPCRNVVQSQAVGIVLTAAGVGLGALAGYLFVTDRRPRAEPATRAGLVPAPGGAAFWVRVRF